MAELKLTNSNFNTVLAENETVLCDFWAPWCGPCKMVGPIIAELAAELEHVAVGKVNVDEEPALARQFSVMSIPTVIVFKNGVEAARTVGFRAKEEYLKML